jgi:ABC-type Zn uptake system ZnuABC Zn-binding protein ZnuA
MKTFSLALMVLLSTPAWAKLKVVTSITDLKSLAESVGKEFVEVQTIAKGTQDPHFLDAKPSYMTRVTNADLVIAIGLGLEDAWLNNVLRGARNPRVDRGGSGFLAVGPLLDPEEIPTGDALSRSQGDVHPEGNPHVTLDPIRMGKAAGLVAAKLKELDPAHSAAYQANADAFKKEMDRKTDAWKKRVEKTGIKKVVTYHKTLNYFIKRMGMTQAAVLEPKPGIAPSVSHLSWVIETMKSQNANVVWIENYFDPTIAGKLRELNPGVKVTVVPVSVEGDPAMKSLTDVYENLVVTLERSK